MRARGRHVAAPKRRQVLLPSAPYRSLSLLVLALASLASACQRKAPGPEECRSFALMTSGATSEDDLRSRAIRDQVDELTRECLVSPYDRELLRCVEESGRFRACRVAFERRRAHPSASR